MNKIKKLFSNKQENSTVIEIGMQNQSNSQYYDITKKRITETDLKDIPLLSSNQNYSKMYLNCNTTLKI